MTKKTINNGSVFSSFNGVDYVYNHDTKTLEYSYDLRVTDCVESDIKPLLEKVSRLCKYGQHVSGCHTKDSLIRIMDNYIERHFVTHRISDTVTYETETRTLKGDKWAISDVLECDIEDLLKFVDKREKDGNPLTGTHSMYHPETLRK